MFDPPSAKQARIFISYKRSTQLDEPLARKVYRQLSQYCHVFIDQTMTVGTDWAREIEEQLGRSDYLIVFLSKDSVQSEMVRGEIETAQRLAHERSGKPRILPVRVAFHDPLQYPLSAYLNRIQWAMWESEADTPRLITELSKAIEGEAHLPSPTPAPGDPKGELPAPTALAQPLKLDPKQVDSTEGTMDPQSYFYVTRSSDSIALNAIQRQGVTITIKGPRQMGKSSLLMRTMESAVKAGKRVVFLDCQLIERNALKDADRFYRCFCNWVTDELEMENQVDEFWNSPLGNSQRCTRYFSRHLLKELNCPLVLAMDEVDNLFDTAFRSDFFSMLRSWHNSRANLTTPIWKQLDLALVTSTEPYQLIKNLNQSPFNVGEVINLDDFTPEQVADLNHRHGKPLNDNEERRLIELLGGQPYLTRRAFYLVTINSISVGDLFDRAIDDRGPFGDHLRYHLFRIHDKEELIEGVRNVWLNNVCDDEHLFFRLHGAGLVKRAGHSVQPRCQLYADFFMERIISEDRSS
jgi:AAA domain-containing protein/TIR domain-containing protein